MKNLLSTAVIATALALLVPNNGAEAVGTGPLHSSSAVTVAEMPATSPYLDAPAPNSKVAWIMALGFLGVIVTRRLRGD